MATDMMELMKQDQPANPDVPPPAMAGANADSSVPPYGISHVYT